jgi:type IV secretory pathway VirB2 component (pilin)
MTAPPPVALFDRPLYSPLAEAAGWIGETLFGTLSVTLCVLAVAFVGLAMLSGRMPWRRAIEVVIGCFILFGAPAIASAFTALIPN